MFARAFQKAILVLAVAGVGLITPALSKASTVGAPAQKYTQKKSDTYSSEEIVEKGHNFFGKATKDVASVVEYAFHREGEPNGYIVGEEGSGAIVGGLRYGEGTLFMKNGFRKKVYWQGPSIGFDFGGNGSRVMVLVYNLHDPSAMFGRFAGIEGSAYVVGGLGVNFQERNSVKLAPIRTGVGLRLGINAGYLKYSERPTWNPF